MEAAQNVARDQLRNERDRFVAFAFAAADLLLEVDDAGIVRGVIGASQALIGRTTGELVGSPLTDIAASADRSLVGRALTRLDSAQRLDPVLVRLRAPDKPRKALLAGCRLPGPGGAVRYMTVTSVGSLLDGTDGLDRDETSGLLGDKSFQASAVRALADARESGKDLSLALVRLDGLEALRRSGTADAVDSLMSEVGGFLRAHSVGGDTAGMLSADKFSVIVNAAESARIVGGLKALVQGKPGVSVESHEVALGASQMTSDDAGKALAYTLKRFAEAEGNFTIGSLADGFKELLRDTVSRVSSIKGILTDDRLSLAFQPIVDLKRRKLHHHEVLARLPDTASPAEMVAFAEGVGLIAEFDLAVCRASLKKLEDPAVGALAVNISGRSLGSDVFVGALTELLSASSNIRQRLMFEITESAEIEDLERAGRIVRMLQDRGHRVCLDDFGAGAASFPYLRALAVDFVKIDGAYITPLPGSGRDMAILRSIGALCRELRIVTVAERVENDEQARTLISLGLDLGQGWLFGKPGPTPFNPELARR